MFNFFQFDIKKVLLIVFVLALPLVSINIQKGPDEAPWYTQPFAFVSGGILNAFTSMSQGIKETVGLYLNLIDTKKNNRVLKKSIDELKAQLGQMEELKLENERLNKLLNFQQSAAMTLIAARVTGLDLLKENDHRIIRINRGTSDGISKGLAVITFDGVVGKVFDAQATFSSVLVLTDRFAAMDAIVQRTRARGIVKGAAVDRCRLMYLHRSDDVLEGDIVVSSGLDNIFPKGFPVATVIEVRKKNYGITQDVELKPIVDASRLEEVFIVLKVETEKSTEVGMLGTVQ